MAGGRSAGTAERAARSAGNPLVAAFLLGFVPMWWLKLRDCSIGFPKTKRQLRLARIQTSLASAVIEVRRGDYESARQAASAFFTSLRGEFSARSDSTLTQASREGVLLLFPQRDELITLLARGDAASEDRLSDLYVSYSEVMSG